MHFFYTGKQHDCTTGAQHDTVGVQHDTAGAQLQLDIVGAQHDCTTGAQHDYTIGSQDYY